MGETELLEYQERRETELPLEEYNLQPGIYMYCINVELSELGN